jgi:hypothetical protein
MTAPDDDAQLAEARHLYVEGRITTADIAARFDVVESTVRRWAVRYDWPRRYQSKLTRMQAKAAMARGEAPPPTRAPAIQPAVSSPASMPVPARAGQPVPESADVAGLVRRIYRAIELNLDLMESRMNDENAKGESAPERDLRALGDVLRSAEKVKELEAGNAPHASASSGRAPRNADEASALRRRLIERIRKIEERHGSGGDDR